ncbi:ankyrin repeat, SAM and basic leucine zipper domain-containing protein 1-like isoform X2 [Mya arenaria]|uniref:ankyrin repeat, SAM and basic leucine zipper domain-containing protein 1-like isoform X2 n=1 Tax=Mya arenaria TaxID=6604 RepID=UPI0022E17515|nr:ankyrin repeat, SAM and basic leucine zipper domain-containing protein 1-like isoform X2 [Mya arenaria]
MNYLSLNGCASRLGRRFSGSKSRLQCKISVASYGDTGVDVTTDARVLFDAVRHGKNHLVRFILEASSVDIVNSRDLHGKTPLMACCYTKEEGARDNTVRLLLRHGADVNLTDDCGRTVLSYVCERRCNDILRILIKEHNIDPDITDTNGNTPLVYSAMVGNDIACDILIRHFRRLGLNVDAKNDEGFTALLMAAKHGNITCAQIVMGQGKASAFHRDSKYGLSVEEWLEKKGFTIQDITPIRHDGKGRSRFVKLANIAAICTGPKKHEPPKPDYGDLDYALNNFQLGKIEDDDDQYLSDATTGTDVSLERLIPRYNDIDMNFASKHYRVYPYQTSRPKLKTQATQTGDDEEDDDTKTLMTNMDYAPSMVSHQMTDITGLDAESVMHRQKNSDKRSNEKSNRVAKSMDKLNYPASSKNTEKSKRLSLPDIDNKSMANRTGADGNGNNKERKKSLEVLPEKLIASIELGDGRRHSITLHTDSIRNKVYWSPVKDDKSSHEDLQPLQFERPRCSVSDSETSTNDDGPIF